MNFTTTFLTSRNISLLLLCGIFLAGCNPDLRIRDLDNSEYIIKVSDYKSDSIRDLDSSEYIIKVSDYKSDSGNIEIVMPDGTIFSGEVYDRRIKPSPAPKVTKTLSPTATVISRDILAIHTSIAFATSDRSDSTQKPWWAPLGDKKDLFKAYLSSNNSRVQMHCDITTINNGSLIDGGSANCYTSSDKWFKFQYNNTNLTSESNPDWSLYDMRLNLYKYDLHPIEPSLTTLPFNKENIEIRYQSINKQDGYSLAEAVIIAQRMLLEQDDSYDIQHPYIDFQNIYDWQIMFLAKPAAARRSYAESSEIGLPYYIRVIQGKRRNAAPAQALELRFDAETIIEVNWSKRYEFIPGSGNK